ncbi:MAG: glycosyl hydrolase family 18 protein, partial [Actinocrinis sp.]
AADIATLHARGQRVLISVNDAGGAVSIDSPGAAAAFASSISSLMKTYGFDGVDIDFEQGLDVAHTAQALRDLAALHPGVLITLAPQTSDVESTSGAYFQLALSIRSILTMSFTQYYNSGTMLGCDGAEHVQGTEDFLTALACTQLRGGLAPSQVGLGLPASALAAKHGYLAPSAVNSALGCLATGNGCGGFTPPALWPDIGGAMTWSINWDASNGYDFLRTVSPYLQSLP